MKTCPHSTLQHSKKNHIWNDQGRNILKLVKLGMTRQKKNEIYE